MRAILQDFRASGVIGRPFSKPDDLHSCSQVENMAHSLPEDKCPQITTAMVALFDEAEESEARTSGSDDPDRQGASVSGAQGSGAVIAKPASMRSRL